MADVHPDSVQSVVRTFQVGRVYEITARSCYLLGAAVAYARSPDVFAFPHATLDDLSSINAVLFTTAEPDAQREGDDLWFLSLGRGFPKDEVQFPEAKALYFPNGLYVRVMGAEDDALDSMVLMRLTYVDRDSYCPARTTPGNFLLKCGPAPEPGPSAEALPWDSQGQAVAQFVVTLGGGKTLTALDGTGIATLQ